MEKIVQWLNANNGAITAILTLISVLATIISVLATIVMAGLMVWANRISARNIAVAIKLDKQRSRPNVLFDIVQRGNMAYAILKNIGQSPAIDVEIKISPMPKAVVNPDSPVTVSKQEHEIGFLTSKTQFLAPTHELSAYLSPFYQFIRNTAPCKFSGSICYRGTDGERYEENFNLNPGIYAAPLLVGEKDVADVLEQVEKSLNNIQKSIERLNQPKPPVG